MITEPQEERTRRHEQSVAGRLTDPSDRRRDDGPAGEYVAETGTSPLGRSTAVTDGPRGDGVWTVIGPAEAPLVLIVEDDTEPQSFLAHTLSTEQRVIAASTVGQALQIIQDLRPDLILLDLLVLGADGEQLVDDLASDPRLATIPVIVVSGRSDDAQRIRMLQRGVHDSVTKPYSSAVMSARIRNVLGRNVDMDELRASVAHAQRVAEQLQVALDSRVVIEQAKGLIAAERRISLDDAFDLIRRHARSNHRRVRDVAEAVVAGFQS